jgi:hypothetical protein
MNKHGFLPLMLLLCSACITASGLAQQQEAGEQDIYSGFYSREGNYGDIAKSSGNSHYIKFYPENRFVRLYIPFPYSKEVTSDAINAAFDAAVKETSGSAYIRGKFGVMQQPVIAHIDSFRRLEGQIMYDCGKARPCRIEFGNESMNEIKPGIVMEHNTPYKRVRIR